MATIFIVDDDLSIVKLLELLFEESGFKVVGTALNGQKAIDKLRNLSKEPDVIIMDYRMPIMDGIEATIEIMKMTVSVKVIFASANIEIKERALKAGAFSVVNKPFDFEELLNSTNEVLNEK